MDHNYNSNDTNKTICDEKIEQLKIKAVKDVVVNRIRNEKEQFLNSMDKSHEEFKEKVGCADDSISKALESRDLDALSKIFANLSNEANSKE